MSAERERPLMLGPVQEFNKKFLEADLPGYVNSLKTKLDEEAAKSSPAEGLARLRGEIRGGSVFSGAEKKRAVCGGQ